MSDSESSQGDYQKLKEIKKRPTSKIMKQLLKASKDKNTVLVGDKSAKTKIKTEKAEETDLLLKRKQTREQRKRGMTAYDDWDKAREKKLKNICVKGITTLFNEILKKRKVIEKEEEEAKVKSKKKSTNFLEMHDLPINS